MYARRLRIVLPLISWLAMAFAWLSAQAAAPAVNESARQIPAAYQVDVVVVGGGVWFGRRKSG